MVGVASETKEPPRRTRQCGSISEQARVSKHMLLHQNALLSLKHICNNFHLNTNKPLNCCLLSSTVISWAVTVLETTEKSKPTRGRQNKRQQAGRHEARRKECAVPDQRDWWIVKPKEGGLVVCSFKQIEDIRVTGSGAGRRASLLDEAFQFPLQMR